MITQREKHNRKIAELNKVGRNVTILTRGCIRNGYIIRPGSKKETFIVSFEGRGGEVHTREFHYWQIKLVD